MCARVYKCKLTVVTDVDLAHHGVCYKAVCHVPKHNTHERQHYAVDHGTGRPSQEQHNVEAVRKPELQS